MGGVCSSDEGKRVEYTAFVAKRLETKTHSKNVEIVR